MSAVSRTSSQPEATEPERAAIAVPRRTGLTAAEFHEEYARKNQPVVLRGEGFFEGGPLTIDGLRDLYGQKRLDSLVDGNGGDIGVRRSHLAQMTTLGDYLDRLEAFEAEPVRAPPAPRPTRRSAHDFRGQKETHDGLPYLTNMSLPLNFPELARRFHVPATLGRNWLLVYPPARKIASGELFIGPSRTSYGELHFDQLSFFVATYQIVGRKQWSLYPPSDSRLLYPMPYVGGWYPHFSPIDDTNPDLNAFPLFAQAERHEVVLEAGDILFCPSSWWHNTRNLTLSISVAIRMMNRANAVSCAFEYALSSAIDAQIGRFRRRIVRRK